MVKETTVSFAGICGAALSPALHRAAATDESGVALAEFSADGALESQDGAIVLVYATCLDHLRCCGAAGDRLSAAVAQWRAEAEAALAAYRADRAGIILVDQTVARIAPRSVLRAVGEKLRAQVPDVAEIVAAAEVGDALDLLIARFGLCHAPRADDLVGELRASSLAIELAPQEQARMIAERAAETAEVDDLAGAVRAAALTTENHVATLADLNAEIASLRDMLDHARGMQAVQAAQNTRLAEQARKIEAQHVIIRSLERDLGEARGSVQTLQNWLQNSGRGAPATSA